MKVIMLLWEPHSSYWFIFQSAYVLTAFVTSKKKWPMPKWSINKHESDKNEKCLSFCPVEV